MLAGKMKLKNFLMMAFLFVGAAIAGFYIWSSSKSGDAEVSDRSPPEPAENRAEAGDSEEPPPPDEDDGATAVDADADASGEPAGREVDEVLFGWVGKDLGSKKKKDVTKGRGYKVNLYQDAGESSMNRAKVDLDRDDLWDEKWTIDGDNISRKVAPADDENYTETWVWNGREWVKEG